MKSLLLLLTITSTALAAGDVGRYQIIAAKITTTSSEGINLSTDTVLKIDTKTGQTWKFSSFLVGQRNISGWHEIKTYKPGEAVVTIEEFNQSLTNSPASK